MSHQLLQIKQLCSTCTWEGGKHSHSSVLEMEALCPEILSRASPDACGVFSIFQDKTCSKNKKQETD